jgi:dihydrofolate reductase
MSRTRVHNFTISLDGFGTGDGQSLDAPFGHGGHLMDWFKSTRTFHTMIGDPTGGETGIDDDFASTWGPGIGAEIMGRNKFGPQRGPWTDEEWTGWWGDEPPFRTPCFVLTHHPRPSIELAGGTTFRFIDASPEEALAEARAAAGGLDVRIGGGATSLRAFLAADLVDHLHVVVAPVLLGRGERLWDGLEALESQFADVQVTLSPSGMTHYVFERDR